MRKVLLAATAVMALATLAPAHAVTSTYIRTINAPTTFGWTDGVISLPNVLANPTDPSKWSKIGTQTTAARCGVVKQNEGVLPAGTAQDSTTGKFGYVVGPLPSGFGSGDSFTLTAHGDNPNFDFDVYFVKSLGKCVFDRTVSAPAGLGDITVPIEGAPPAPRFCETAETGGSSPCPVTAFTKIGRDSGTLTFDADHAIVVMPIGANGKFTLAVTY